jgi:O-antigen/teichoic acid export membrane protein
MDIQHTTDKVDSSGTSGGDIHILAKGSGVALFGKLASRGLQLVTVAILARVLGPVAYGLYALSQTVLQLASKLALWDWITA